MALTEFPISIGIAQDSENEIIHISTVLEITVYGTRRFAVWKYFALAGSDWSLVLWRQRR